MHATRGLERATASIRDRGPSKGHRRLTFGNLRLMSIESAAEDETVAMTRGCTKTGDSMSSVLGEGRWLLAVTLMSLGGCNGAPSRNILGSYFPSWMVCALLGIAVAGIARAIFKATGILQELPVPFVVFLAIGGAATFALWLLWLS